jgi:predicted PurR-regulated permease PerM
MHVLNAQERALSQTIVDALVRAGLVATLAVACYQVFQPFLSLMLWSLILAVTLYPLHLRLKRRMGGRDGRAATLLVLISVLVMLAPVCLVGVSLLESAREAITVVKGGDLHVPPPPDAVRDWPVVGKKLHGAWTQASIDLTPLAQKFSPQIKAHALSALGKIAGIGIGLLLFFAALAIAGIIMAFGELGQRSAVAIAARLFGPDRGEATAHLCTSTIRAVALGVIGIAFIQALLLGLGFALIGLPGTGILVLVLVVLGILQVPAMLVSLPVIGYVFYSQGADAGTIVFAVYTFIAGLADNVLKPLLLGRGVDVPMPVVLIGAIGGMITSGILGLFIGPVMLAVGYQLFWQWVDSQQEAPASPTPPADEAAGEAATASAPA